MDNVADSRVLIALSNQPNISSLARKPQQSGMTVSSERRVVTPGLEGDALE